MQIHLATGNKYSHLQGYQIKITIKNNKKLKTLYYQTKYTINET